MAVSNRDRVGRALDLLKSGLLPFTERELRAKHGQDWAVQAKQVLLPDNPAAKPTATPADWDVAALLNIMIGHWQYIFRYKLGKTERGLLGELQDIRNRWAHQEVFTLDDTNRALDTAKRLLAAISAPEAAEVDALLQEVLRQKFEELTKKETKRAVVAAVEGKPAGGLRPWREVVTPHPDVASGKYQQAEFAADLAQVHRGEGGSEYRDPKEFFRRTFLTEGLRRLLVGAATRLSGGGGDPVVELQTNFGGGKTHSMLALYHMVSGVAAADLAGIDGVLKEAGVDRLPKARRAVLVGTAISPAKKHRKPDGTVVQTLWGEMAWQLGGKEGYAFVKEADERGVSPGEDLVELFRAFSPCLILIDEWVAFARQLYGIDDLPAGRFDANLTFAQALTESAKKAPGTLVVASLPASDIEIGGEGGQQALALLKNTFSRLHSTWKPATADESFEIVRRRLFQQIPSAMYPARDAVARAFSDMYRAAGAEFPSECKETEYERRLLAAYPIHPELFDRLFQDWSSLDSFQRTRGVLRLMAAVIHSLWERQDGNLLILPATVPIDDPPVQYELTRYMEDHWTPVIEKDVDGPNSLPLRVDRENPALGRLSAARRVARTLYLGSAATLHSANKGIDDRRIKLGCVQPGETSATFGDALRRLSDQATHLYVDGNRYWLSTQPSLTRLAEDRAAQQSEDDVWQEITKRLQAEQSHRGEFVKVHVCPGSSGDVPDELECRLVVLNPGLPHTSKSDDSPALLACKEILEHRGATPRLNRNTLVFLAADKTRLKELQQAIRQYLAWQSIKSDGENQALNLDGFQRSQAQSKTREAEEAVLRRIPETYQWLLVPGQPSMHGPIEWSEVRLQGADRLAPRASKKLINDGALSSGYAGTLLRMELDRVPLWRGDSVSVKQLVDDFAQYLYLQRLKSPQVLLDAIRDGVSRLTWQSEGFAYADFFDDKKKRFAGLRTATIDVVVPDGKSQLVKPDVASKQLSAEAVPAAGGGARAEFDVGTAPGATSRPMDGQPSPARPKHPRRFYGVVEVDATRLGRDAGRIAQEILAHLTGLADAEVTVTIEIAAEVPDGVEEAVVRTVTENCRVLKFRSHAFEAE